MDFFLGIYLSFYFQLFPFYHYRNPQLEESLGKRSIGFRFKRFDELFVLDFKEVKLIISFLFNNYIIYYI